MPYLLASLVWLSPLWGWGIAAAVGLPVLAHLLSRRRYRPVEFPALRFVMAAASRAAAVDRPRHLLLLLLRGLALLAVVAAFMQPVWRTQAAVVGEADGGNGQTLVILLDASASMRRTAQGRSAFEQAQAQADRLIDKLEPGKDRAMVFPITDRARPLLPEPTGNLSLLQDRLASAACTWQGDDLSALTQAMETARKFGRTRAVWITDGQHARAAQNLPLPGLALRTVSQPVQNTAVNLVEVRPNAPVAGQPVTVTVRVRHFGPQPTLATLVIRSGDHAQSRAIQLKPGEDRLVGLVLEHAPAQPGWITVALDQPDAFPADDTAGVFVKPIAARPVVCLTDVGLPVSSNRIAAMLAPPAGEPGGLSLTPNQITLSTPDEAERRDAALDPAAVIVISGLDRPMAQSLRERLVAHAQAGGGVVWFADTPASREAIGQMPGPMRFGLAQANATLVEQTRIDFEQDAMRLFEGPARDLLARVAWPGVHPATLSPNAAALIASPSAPVVAGSPLGRGMLYVINADPLDPANELTLDPAFVVLFNELVRLAAPGPEPPAVLRPGDPLPAEWVGQAIRDENTQATIVTTAVTTPGAIAAVEQGKAIDGRWVELNLDESDLARVGAISSSESEPSASVAGRPWASELADDTRPLWPYAMLVGLLLLSAEATLLASDRRGGGA